MCKQVVDEYEYFLFHFRSRVPSLRAEVVLSMHMVRSAHLWPAEDMDDLGQDVVIEVHKAR